MSGLPSAFFGAGAVEAVSRRPGPPRPPRANASGLAACAQSVTGMRETVRANSARRILEKCMQSTFVLQSMPLPDTVSMRLPVGGNIWRSPAGRRWHMIQPVRALFTDFANNFPASPTPRRAASCTRPRLLPGTLCKPVHARVVVQVCLGGSALRCRRASPGAGFTHVSGARSHRRDFCRLAPAQSATPQTDSTDPNAQLASFFQPRFCSWQRRGSPRSSWIYRESEYPACLARTCDRVYGCRRLHA